MICRKRSIPGSDPQRQWGRFRLLGLTVVLAAGCAPERHAGQPQAAAGARPAATDSPPKPTALAHGLPAGQRQWDAHGSGHAAHDEHDPHASSQRTRGARLTDDAEEVVTLSRESASLLKIRTAPVLLRDLPPLIHTTGEVAFDQDRVAHVSPRLPGRVSRVYAKLGDTVKAGQTLAVLDSIELGQLKATYLQARAQRALAKNTLLREEQLLKEYISSAREAWRARAVHQKAMADYRAARQRLRLVGLSKGAIEGLNYDKMAAALVAVRSPIAGRITQKHVTLGELVRPSTNLFTVADLSSVWVWVDVYERDLAHVHLNDKVALRVDAYPRRSFVGDVGYIGDELDRKSRAVRARLDVPNEDRSLKPGMFARVRISDPHDAGGSRARRKALVVPATAVARGPGGQLVFVKLGVRRFRRQRVVLGAAAAADVEVLEGLKGGENVVSEGAFILKSELEKTSMRHGHSH